MPPLSAGLLMYRIREGVSEVLLAHPGGPFFRKKDEHAWKARQEKLLDELKRLLAERPS